MQTNDWLSQGESIIYEGKANMQYNVKGINLPHNKGGCLILTNKNLVFQAHAFNLGSKLDKIPLENIANVDKGFSPLVPTPNMIKVETRLGEKYEFVVVGRDKEKWLEMIPKAVKECSVDAKKNKVMTNYDTVPNNADKIYKCSNCGYTAQNNFKFCPKCGEASKQEKHCHNCGSICKEGQKFCTECGAKLINEE